MRDSPGRRLTPWSVIYEHWDPAQQPLREALCTLGNGYFATRGAAEEHVFGYSPKYEDLEWKGLDFSRDDYQRITAIDPGQWREELRLHDELFAKLAARLPGELRTARQALEEKLSALPG